MRTHCANESQRSKPINTSCSFIRCSGNGVCTPNKFPRRPYTHTVEPCALEDNGASCKCACFPPWIGSRCNRRIPFRCLRNCGGTTSGRCLTDTGVCLCEAGFEGIDCHLAGAAMASTDSVSRVRKIIAVQQPRPLMPRIYVYDRPLPEDYFAWGTRDLLETQQQQQKLLRQQPEPRKQQPRHQGLGSSPLASHWPSYPDRIYQAGDAFFHLLLRDREHRTYDPLSADLFLLPLERVFIQNTYDVRVSVLIRHWIERWLIGQRMAKGPLDRHIWIISTDQCGAGGSPLAMDAFRKWFVPYGGVVLCHYALPHRLRSLLGGHGQANRSLVLAPGSPLDALAAVAPSAAVSSAKDEDGGGGGGDGELRWTQPSLVAQSRRAWGLGDGNSCCDRQAKLLFWGSVRLRRGERDVGACVAHPAAGSPFCSRLYSRGVRQVMWMLYANHSFADFRSSEEPSLARSDAKSGRGEHGERLGYYETLLRTEYCLVATGSGFGVRLIDYLASGCIPVIVNSSVWYPYEQPGGSTELRYEDFAHVFPLERAAEVVDVLQAESDAERGRRRSMMRRFYRRFLWDEGQGTAYQTTLEALGQVARDHATQGTRV